MSIASLPGPAKIALAIGGALALGFALWRVADMLGLMGSAPATGSTVAPTEAAPTAPSTARVPVGTDSTGAPILGTGITAIDKSPANIAARVAAAARRLTS